MTHIGYSLIGEQHGPDDLVEAARRAERAGFSFALASDHFHPWLDSQGHSPFVWTTLGAIARETSDLRVGTGVTCPLFRIHPAIVAQAAATAAVVLPDRFFLGVGTGENLNEHVVGDRWPPYDVRLERLEEAVEVIRRLWTGEPVSHHGEVYTVENAKLYTTPDDPPPLHVAAGGESSAEAAARFGDGMIATAPEESLVQTFRDGGGGDERPVYGQVTVCWAESESEARTLAHERWPNSALPGELGQELPSPIHFEQATSAVTEADVAETVVCGPDPDDHVESIQQFVDAGFEHVSVHDVGPDQEAAIEFYESEVLPSFQ